MPSEIKVSHLQSIVDYVSQKGSITNRECRELTGLTYDDSIKMFAALCQLGILEKVGSASATKYVLPDKRASTPPRDGYHRKSAVQ